MLFVWQLKDGDILPVKKKRGEYEFAGGVEAPKEWGGMAQRMKLQLCDVADVNAQQLILSVLKHPLTPCPSPYHPLVILITLFLSLSCHG